MNAVQGCTIVTPMPTARIHWDRISVHVEEDTLEVGEFVAVRSHASFSLRRKCSLFMVDSEGRILVSQAD